MTAKVRLIVARERAALLKVCADRLADPNVSEESRRYSVGIRDDILSHPGVRPTAGQRRWASRWACRCACGRPAHYVVRMVGFCDRCRDRAMASREKVMHMRDRRAGVKAKEIDTIDRYWRMRDRLPQIARLQKRGEA